MNLKIVVIRSHGQLLQGLNSYQWRQYDTFSVATLTENQLNPALYYTKCDVSMTQYSPEW